MSDSLQAEVYKALASGAQRLEDLAQARGTTVSAVRAAVDELRRMGLALDEAQGWVAMPAAFTPLDAATISAGLDQRCRHRVGPVEVAFSVGSTNDELLADRAQRKCLLAEHQAAGRGRAGRAWASPLGASLYLSMKRPFPEGVQPSGCLSLGIGQAVAARLNALGVAARVKWPNDLYVARRKLAGMLLESRMDERGRWSVVIGIGVNYDLPAQLRAGGQLRATDFVSECATNPVDRNRLAAAVIEAVDTACREFAASGPAQVQSAWPRWDAFPGEAVEFEHAGRRLVGRASGIDRYGRLQVHAEDGRTLSLSAGEVHYQVLQDVGH